VIHTSESISSTERIRKTKPKTAVKVFLADEAKRSEQLCVRLFTWFSQPIYQADRTMSSLGV
jgi:hypothetical protein